LDYLGYKVTREYYFNDAGTQISKLVQSIRAEAGEEIEGERQYSGAYIKELAKDLEPYLEKGDDQLAAMATQMIFERYIKDAIEKMHISFDEWFNEKHLVDSGQFKAALERLKKADLVYEKEGATWLASSKYGDERDRVLVKSTGDITYLGNDIPYHLNIFEERGFERAIKVWGADHAGQVPSLKLTVAKLLPDKQLDFMILQWVRLIKDGQEVKMSKRAGTYVTVEELIDEVGSDVARFFFLMRSADSQMDFDLGLAKEQSQKNPLWYVMYSYARAHSILRQAADKKLKPATKLAELSDQEREMAKMMAQFPGLLLQTGNDYGLQRLPFYGYELARLFHDYYEGEKIIDLPGTKAANKLYFVQQYIEFMKNYFDVLGITPIEKM
jgi:arginyl-tRNA synthetase